MTESREFCESCQRWLEHDQRFCPLFPDVRAVRGYGSSKRTLPKWIKCACMIHTCYDAERRNPSMAPTYKDFAP